MKTRLLVTQGGADTYTASQLSLPALDGRSGYQFSGMKAFWADGEVVAASDHWLRASVQVGASALTFLDDEWIMGVAWGCQNTGGVAVALPVELFRKDLLMEPRVSVQPEIYCAVRSAGTGNANDVIFEVHYDIIKLSELEYLRLLAGGA